VIMKLVIAILFLLISLPIYSETESIGKIKSIVGDVIILRDGKTHNARLGMQIFDKDEVVTNKSSNCSILFKDNTLITLDQNTKYVISSYKYDPKNSKYDLKGEIKSGKILFNSGKIPKIASNNVAIKTPTATVGVKGTKFIVETAE